MAEDFKEYADGKIMAIVKSHEHPHPLFEPTEVSDFKIDEEGKRAVFVLFEQTDTDRLSEDSLGFLGDEYRFSLIYLEGEKEPRKLYEDEAWIKRDPKTYWKLDGRSAFIELVALEADGVVIKAYSEKEAKRKEKKISFDATPAALRKYGD